MTGERYCRRCDEWWPDDAEFWLAKRNTKVCKACQREWNRLGHERRMRDNPEGVRARWRRAAAAYRQRVSA